MKNIMAGGICPSGEKLYTCTIYFQGGGTSTGGVACGTSAFNASARVQRVISREVDEMVGVTCL